VGLDSKEGFTEMDKDGNVVDGVRIEVMEFKPVIIEKAAEERTRGEDDGGAWLCLGIFVALGEMQIGGTIFSHCCCGIK
jgi:hypothetical protein